MHKNRPRMKTVGRRRRRFASRLSWIGTLCPLMVCAQQVPVDALSAIPTVAAVHSDRTRPLFGDIQAGPLTITLETTTLAAIQQAFGGAIKHRGDAGDSAYWLCYTALGIQTASDAAAHADVPRIVLFVSNGEMGGSTHTLSTVALERQGRPARTSAPADVRAQVRLDGHLSPLSDQKTHQADIQRADASSNDRDDCPNAPMVLQHLDFGIPPVGAPVADVESALGRPNGDRDGKRDGNLVYASEFPAAGTPGATTLQTVQYTIRSGAVAGIALTQVTTN